MHSSEDRPTLRLPLTGDVFCARPRGGPVLGEFTGCRQTGTSTEEGQGAEFWSGRYCVKVAGRITELRVRSPWCLALSLRRDEGASHAHLGWCP